MILPVLRGEWGCLLAKSAMQGVAYTALMLALCVLLPVKSTALQELKHHTHMEIS